MNTAQTYVARLMGMDSRREELKLVKGTLNCGCDYGLDCVIKGETFGWGVRCVWDPLFSLSSQSVRRPHVTPGYFIHFNCHVIYYKLVLPFMSGTVLSLWGASSFSPHNNPLR